MNQHAPKHFFISYNKTDRTWAEWIAWHLEEAGYTTIIQAWDFRPGMSFVQKMHAAVQEAERTIAVLSTNYLEALYTYPEWEAAFKQDPRGEKGMLVPVRIQECKPPGLLGLISYINLVGLDDAAARETLLDGVRQGRNKPPTAPLFPGSISETQRAVPQQPRFPGAFPPIWNVPYSRNPYFTGRNKVLENLHEALSRDSATALTQGYAISGLGGIGKTQTAVEYTYRYRSEYRFIFWIRADTEVALQAGCVEMAKLLDLPEQDATNPAETVQAVKHWLEHTGEWLLIFDNADTPELLKAYYPRQPRGHVLLTSRAQLFDTLGIARPLALEKMQPDEALSFLFKRTERAQSEQAEQQAAAHLAAELGYLPLALEQAAAYITAKMARFQDYLTSYQQQRLVLLNKAQPRMGEYPESVASTWALNFQEVEKEPVAADILRVSAFLSPEGIPLELLSSGASQLGPVLAGALATSEDPLALNEALEPLTRYSLIRRDVDAQTYSIHRMVQEVVKGQMGVERQAEWAERAVRAVEQSFPEVSHLTWTRCERYIPHALLCAAYIDRWSMTFPQAKALLFEAGYYFYQWGQFWEAEPLWNSVLAICERVLGPEHPDTLSSLNSLAELYRNQGKYELAAPLFQRALATYERVLGPEHPDTLGTVNNLAVLYRSQGKDELAEPLYQRMLATYERVLGPEHPNTLNTVNNLANLYQNQGKYEQAAPLYQRALAIYEQKLGADHPDTTRVRNNYANLVQEMKRKTEAAPSKPKAPRKQAKK
jgi:tetratricopeptide (TPR) repeat protein